MGELADHLSQDMAAAFMGQIVLAVLGIYLMLFLEDQEEGRAVLPDLEEIFAPELLYHLKRQFLE
jgi:hypothetical protein